MHRLFFAWVLLLGLVMPASADVVDATPNGFALKYVQDIAAPREAVYRAIEDIARWWDPAHSYSGNAGNLSLDVRAGGCFCETLASGSVQHMLVVRASAPETVVLHGGLGPLAALGATGSMVWSLTARDGGTHLEVTYNVGGYMPGGLAQLAPAVDGVLATQVIRLKTLVETGRPQ